MKTRKRNTVRKRIAKLPPDLAIQVAEHGRTLDPIEHAAVEYLRALRVSKLVREREPQSVAICDLITEQRWDAVSFKVMVAVQDRDWQSLEKLARTVQNFNPDRIRVRDSDRAQMLLLKRHVGTQAPPPTAGEIARAYHIEERTVRRIAVELGWKLRRAPAGRPPKNSDK